MDWQSLSPTPAPASAQQPLDVQALADYLSSSKYFTDENPQARISALLKTGILSEKQKNGIPSWISEGINRGRASVLAGSKGAEQILREGYERDFAARAATAVGSYRSSAGDLASRGAAMGLSGDVVSRLAVQPRLELPGQIAALRGGGEKELSTMLAELFKGTGTELAGLSRDELALAANLQNAKIGAKGARQGGQFAAFGEIAGALLA